MVSGEDGKRSWSYVVAAIIAIAVIGAVWIVSTRGTQGGSGAVTTTGTTTSGILNSTNQGQQSYVIQLTDPPTVPSGTQALLITYSSVGLHETEQHNGTGYINFAANGTVNLLNLTNVTQTIAVIRADTNQSFDMVRFNISSAYIEIGNVTYNVTLAGKDVVAKIASSLDSNSSGVVVDLSPVVLEVYTSNQTTFVMLPSADAVVIGKDVVNMNGARPGQVSPIPLPLRNMMPRPNVNQDLVITNESLSSNGVNTTIGITVENYGNSSIKMNYVALSGIMETLPSIEQQSTVSSSGTPPHFRGTRMSFQGYTGALGTSSSGHMGIGMGSGVGAGMGMYGNIRVQANYTLNSEINSTVLSDFHIAQSGTRGRSAAQSNALSEYINAAQIFESNFHSMLDFVVDSNGTLGLPYAQEGGCEFASSEYNCPAMEGRGYALAPGQSAKLEFSGKMRFGLTDIGVVPVTVSVMGGSGMRVNGTMPGSGADISVRLPGPIGGGSVVVLIPNQTYSVSVHGVDNGTGQVYANSNGVATGNITGAFSKFVDVTSIREQLHTSNATYNYTLPGFLAAPNSTVTYTVYAQLPGPVPAIASAPGYAQENLTGFSLAPSSFSLLNVADLKLAPCAEACPKGVSCYQCLSGWNNYVLSIRTPQSSYYGQLTISANETVNYINST